MSNVTLDCSKYSAPVLKAMLADPVFAIHHETIKAHFAPKPKDFTPRADKVVWKGKKANISTTFYPTVDGTEGYVRLEPGFQGKVCLKANALDEVIAHLLEVRKSL
jgi:hypothetical protein